MRIGGSRIDRLGHLVLAVAIGLAGLPAAAHAQFFNPLAVQRPPADVPSVPPGPAQSIAPPAGNPAPAPKGPQLQSLPPTAVVTPSHGPSALPAGQVPLSVSARFGRDLPAINGGLHWRIYKPEQNGVPRLVKEDKGAAPVIALAPGNYVINVAFGLATATKAVQVRSDAVREVFEIPAGGLRIEGRVGDVRIPQGQISFDALQGQPVRARRQASARPQRHDRRRGAGAGGHLSHRVELRRRQFGGALRHPRAGRQAHRHHRSIIAPPSSRSSW